MRIGVLTSSRADFGIYQSLLDQIIEDSFFDLTIIAFGMHCSPLYGDTLHEIKSKYTCKIDTIACLLGSDDVPSITTSFGITVLKFADYWAVNSYDIVICLGDRFEMTAAVQAGLLANVKFAHIHGGETTLGALDNIFRHQITLASKYHFVSTSIFAEKVEELIGKKDGIFCVGSISLDGIEEFEFTPENELRDSYNFPIGEYILVTFHPETANNVDLEIQLKSLIESFEIIIKKYNIIITMPNADAAGSRIRSSFIEFNQIFEGKVLLVESFGKKNYFSAMKFAKLLVGNTSSGIIEAASLGKFVLNIGDRQKGRAQSGNVINVGFENILGGFQQALIEDSYLGENIYKKSNTVEKIVLELKKINEAL